VSSSILSAIARVRFAPILLGFALALSVGVCAAQPKQDFNEKTREAFGKLKPLSEAKNFDGMLALLEGLTPTVDPNSYDMAFILDMEAKLYGHKEQFEKAIDAWERSLKIAEGKGYFEEKEKLEKMLYLAQFCYQVSVNSKDPAVQKKYSDKSAGYFKKWLAATPKPPADIMVFYASILYNQAVADPKKVDMALLKEARAEIEKGIANTAHPKETLYVLLLAVLQQENDSVKAAETLELLLKNNPQKKDFWPSLWATYLNMATETGSGGKKDEAKVQENYIRSINTLERAQALGFMKSPRENLQLVGLYINVGQYGKATDILYAGLKNGSIESDQKNWALLGYYFQQANEPKKAIDALKEAATIFPKTGSFDFQIGQIYLAMEKTKEATPHLREAVRRGGLDRPAVALQTLAYALYDLEEFDEALEVVKKAEAFPDAQKDGQLARLKFGIEASIKDREAAKAESAKKMKSLR